MKHKKEDTKNKASKEFVWFEKGELLTAGAGGGGSRRCEGTRGLW